MAGLCYRDHHHVRNLYVPEHAASPGPGSEVMMLVAQVAVLVRLQPHRLQQQQPTVKVDFEAAAHVCHLLALSRKQMLPPLLWTTVAQVREGISGQPCHAPSGTALGPLPR
ncbi:hypothetical protein Vafri_422 [Volvox africanus]|nr:hypothetical protein Vafri_422 [Volvox africanus]